jgi:two-component system response regulator HydG
MRALRKAAGVKTETARILGIKTPTLYYKLEKYGMADASES